MKVNLRFFPIVCLLSFASALSPFPIQAATTMSVKTDATGLPRGLLKTEIHYAVSPGVFELYYPRWVPGIHGPRSPIQNLAEIEVLNTTGEKISWRRDPLNVFHFLVDVPKGIDQIHVQLTYICNQPSVNSKGVDSYGNPFAGVICWNTCLLYPAGHNVSDIEVDLSLELPQDWKWGSSLSARHEKDNVTEFEPLSLRELIDSPLICGQYYRRFDITPEKGTPHFLHLISESERQLRPKDERIQKFQNLTAEAMKLFGTQHDYPYHLLLVLSDSIPFLGLEHHRSSLNVVGENGLEEDKQFVRTGHLLAHEYGHRWCGKYHRPEGMLVPDYNTPKDTRLLWVYEGLDQYLGVVLAARSGLLATEERTSFEGALWDDWIGVGYTITKLMRQKGRRSIDLEDTAASSYLRRQRSKYWSALNRSQDYYFEGALLWYEIDAILRHESFGKVCLDDFIKEFLGRYDKEKMMMEFNEETVLEFLNSVHAYNWKALIDDRVRGLHDNLPLTVLERLGYQLHYSSTPTKFDDDPSLTSLGIEVSSGGKITTIIPGSPADKAGLFEDCEIVGINGRKFNENRLKDAIAESVAKREIIFLIFKGDLLETIVMKYDDGPKYLDFVRDKEKPDMLAKIFAPRVSENLE